MRPAVGGPAARSLKALSIRAPWSELIARGEKTVEVRVKRTHYRGPLLVCSGVAWAKFGVAHHGKIGARGVAVCLVDLVDCRELTPEDSEAAGFDVTTLEKPHFAWVLKNARRVEAVPMLGQLSMFTPPVIPAFAP